MGMSMRENQWLLTEKYGGRASADFRRDRARLSAGEPLAYVIGDAPFLGVRIMLSRRALIPRPETEFWTERVIQFVRSAGESRTLSVCDAFSGSGCIGIAVAAHIPQAHVDCAEIDPGVTRLARASARSAGISRRMRFYRSDCLDGLPREKTYDIITANPPYLSRARANHIQKSVLSYEPHRALFAGDEGMELIKRTIDGLSKRLRPGGSAFIEFDSPQRDRLMQYAASRAAGWTRTIWNDHYGRPRVLVLTRPPV